MNTQRSNFDIRPCTVPTPTGPCPAPLYAKGMCQRHYGINQRHGDPTYVRQTTTGKPCPEEEDGSVCGRPITARKMCAAHYARKHRTGSTVAVKRRLSPAQVREIQRRYKKGDPVDGGGALAREFGITPQTVSRTLRRTTYQGAPLPAEESEPLDPFGP